MANTLLNPCPLVPTSSLIVPPIFLCSSSFDWCFGTPCSSSSQMNSEQRRLWLVLFNYIHYIDINRPIMILNNLEQINQSHYVWNCINPRYCKQLVLYNCVNSSVVRQQPGNQLLVLGCRIVVWYVTFASVMNSKSVMWR